MKGFVVGIETVLGWGDWHLGFMDWGSQQRCDGPAQFSWCRWQSLVSPGASSVAQSSLPFSPGPLCLCGLSWHWTLPCQYLGGYWNPLVFRDEKACQTIKQMSVVNMGFPDVIGSKEPACQCRRLKTCRFSPSWEDPLEEGMETHSNILPGESLGQRTWWAIVYGISKSQTWLKWLNMHTL